MWVVKQQAQDDGQILDERRVFSDGGPGSLAEEPTRAGDDRESALEEGQVQEGAGAVSRPVIGLGLPCTPAIASKCTVGSRRAQ